MGREAAQALVQRIVQWSRADAVHVTVDDGITTNLRFADNRVTTSGWVQGGSVTVVSTFGRKHAAVETDDLSDASLKETVARSEALAKLAPDDPETLPPLPPQRYGSSDAHVAATANADATARARVAMAAIAPARRAKVLASGYLEVNDRASVVANGTGLFGYYPSTVANYTLTVRSADGTGSGWAGAETNDWSRLDFSALARRAIQKAVASRKPVAIEPGRYTVVLEPEAVGDLVQLVSDYLGAREADEGRSPFSKKGGGNKIGTRILDPRVTLFSDPADPELRAQPFDDDGLPLGRQVWVDHGVLRQLYYSRFWAQKQGRPATGSPTSLKMSGGEASLDEMIRGTRLGILVTRLWYLREVDPRTMLYTGLTRDGTFLIEGGKITHAVKNLRFNESPLFLLNNVTALGRPERIGGTEGGGPIVVPPIRANDFSFTSLSDAV